MAARQIILTLLALAAIGYGIHRFEHMRKHTDTYCAAGAGYLGGQLLHELERGRSANQRMEEPPHGQAKVKRAVIYARVSTDGQTTDNQVQELRATAERNGWTVVEEFVDRGISRAKGREHRPAFDRLWRGAARKDFDVVMVWSVDRLGRASSTLLSFCRTYIPSGSIS